MKRFFSVLGLLWLACVVAQEADILSLPELSAASFNGPLKVVATTSIVGDVVAQVGGDAISLTTLMGPGQDPHSFEPAARDLATASEAQVVFVNGWGLEESLLITLESVGEGAPLVPVSAGITPLEFGDDEHGEGEHSDDEHGEDEHSDDENHSENDDEDHEHHDEEGHGEEHDEEDGEEHGEEAHGEDKDGHDHHGADPHTWQNVSHVMQWTQNIQTVLSSLDPANADTYAANAATYLAALEELEGYAQTTLSELPEAQRKLVTNHDAFGYLAEAYGFEVVGTVIPSLSTLAEPSASDLVELITEMEQEGICTLFTETTTSNRLAETVAAELDGCDAVQVLPLYTGAIGAAGSGADSYIGMVRANVDTLTLGLTPQ